MAEVDLSSGQWQSPFVDDEIRNAALDAGMTGFATDEELAVGRQQRRFHWNLDRDVLVDLEHTSFSSSSRSDVVEDSVVHSFLQLYSCREIHVKIYEK